MIMIFDIIINALPSQALNIDEINNDDDNMLYRIILCDKLSGLVLIIVDKGKPSEVLLQSRCSSRRSYQGDGFE